MHKKKVIDTKGHCVFCFERFDLFDGIGSSDSSSQQSLNEVWPYIFTKWNDNLSSKFNFVTKSGQKTSSSIPPMCISCRGQIEKITKLHEEIVQLSTRLGMLMKEVTSAAQTVRDKVKGHRLDCEDYRDTLKGILVNAGVTLTCVDNIMEFLRNICDSVQDGNNASEKDISHTSSRSLRKRAKLKGYTDQDIDFDDVKETSKASARKTRKGSKKSNVSVEDIKEEVAEISEDIKLEPEWNDNDDSINENIDSLMDPDFDLEEVEEEEKEPPTKREKKSTSSNAQPHPRPRRGEKNRPQTCEVCGKPIPLKEMYNHMRDHVGDYAIKCANPKCDMMFLGRWSIKYRIHMEGSKKCNKAAGGSIETPQKVCAVCGEQFENFVVFGSHLIRHENFDKNFPCPISNCGESFTTKQSVEYHLRSHGFRSAKKKLFQKCGLCQERISPNEMESHLKEKHDYTCELIKCKQCPFVFLKREDLLDHVVIKSHMKVGVSCDLCSENDTFHNGYRLRDHYYTTHNLGTKHLCTRDGCDYSTFSETVLRLHILKFHEKKGIFYRCSICCDPPVEYVTELALRSHNIKFHGSDPYKCRFCEKVFTAKQYLDEHEKKHMGLSSEHDRPHQCNACGKVLSTRQIYLEHVKLVHNSIREHKCETCGKVFKRPKSLKLHERMEHLGVHFCCDTCGRTFKRPELFKQHQRIHTGERPFTCEKCGKTFRQRCTWKTHMKSHETKGDRFVPKGSVGKP